MMGAGRLTGRLLIASTMALGMLGCTPAAIEPHDPTLTGVVQAKRFIGARTASFTLAGGGSVQIDLEATQSLRPEGTEPSVGDLLLYGRDARGAWFVAVPPTSSGFELRVQPAAPSAASLMFDFGLRLPLAANYREGGGGQLEAGAPVIYLINDQGEVAERR